ncbi:UNKNOWN [Stylonychia lemnae]|uniref:DRBM domain-containing protein n=1 Tax=Stylonychia lemnae TaxID=5949 RepID=A0A078AX47_STYLE|nr:UNKNOWN [Stylonychia lemnae]|eukprot:CDW87020.1 UNKNOWN [Stylonychia lemnae]
MFSQKSTISKPENITMANRDSDTTTKDVTQTTSQQQAKKQYITHKKLYEIKGQNKNSEQISLLVSIGNQCFQLAPQFRFEGINEGRDRYKCIVEFQNTFISTGNGHNKTESKKQAAKNALRIVAPKIFKEVFPGEPLQVATQPKQLQKINEEQKFSEKAGKLNASQNSDTLSQPTKILTRKQSMSKHSNIQQKESMLENISGQNKETILKKSSTHKMIQSQPNSLRQSYSYSQNDMITQTNARRSNLSQFQQVECEDEDDEINIYDELQIQNLNHQRLDIILGDKDILKYDYLFKKYSPFTLLEIFSKKNGYQMDKHKQNNKSSNPDCQIKFLITLQDKATMKISFSATETGPNKETCKNRTALTILRQIFSPNKKWLELVEEISQTVYDDRLKRGVGEKPVLRKYIPETNQLVERRERPIHNPLVYGSQTNMPKQNIVVGETQLNQSKDQQDPMFIDLTD